MARGDDPDRDAFARGLHAAPLGARSAWKRAAGPNAIRHFEQSLQAVADLEISDYVRFELISQVDDYVFGYSLREAQDREEEEAGWTPEVIEYLQSLLDKEKYPLIREFLGGDAGAAIDLVSEFNSREGRFERGLARLLDGIEAGLAS